MKLIDDLLARVQEFERGLSSGQYLMEIVEDNEPYICDMNSEQQLFEQGVNRLGVSIMDYQPYRPLTIEYKRAKGQPYNRVTLRDTGDFHASFYVEATADKFEIKASDSKTPDLVKKYGKQILGLTDENKNELTWEYIYPDLIEKRNLLLYGKSTN